MLKESESDFLSWVTDLAKVRGWLVYHTWLPVHSEAGFPDLVMVKGKRLVFSELKSRNGRVSPDQVRWLALLADTPAEVYTWRPSDREEIERVLC